MSLIVFAGGSQFAVVTVLAAGGGVIAAVLAGVLINLRFLPMSVAITPSMPGGLPRRVLMSQAITDPGWAISVRAGGRFDAYFMVGAVLPQYVLWQLGTVAGVLLGSALTDPEALGTDALFPAFFLAILLGGELGAGRTAVIAAVLGGVIALALTPLLPAGLPLIAASAAALVALARPGQAPGTASPGGSNPSSNDPEESQR